MARDLHIEVEELEETVDNLRAILMAERVNYNNRISKFEDVCSIMWGGIETAASQDVESIAYLLTLVPEIKQKLTHLGIIEGDYLTAQQDADNYRYAQYDKIRELENLTYLDADKIELLEELCRDMYDQGAYPDCFENWSSDLWQKKWHNRMKTLGLLEGEE